MQQRDYHFRIVSTGFWTDSKVEELDKDATLIFLHMLTSPLIDSLGVVPYNPPLIEAQCKMLTVDQERAICELSDASLIVVDEKRYQIALPNYARYNQPYNINQAKGRARIFHTLAAGELKDSVYDGVVRWWPQPYVASFLESLNGSYVKWSTQQQELPFSGNEGRKPKQLPDTEGRNRSGKFSNESGSRKDSDSDLDSDSDKESQATPSKCGYKFKSAWPKDLNGDPNSQTRKSVFEVTNWFSVKITAIRTLSLKAGGRIHARLLDYTADELRKAIDNYAASDWIKGGGQPKTVLTFFSDEIIARELKRENAGDGEAEYEKARHAEHEQRQLDRQAQRETDSANAAPGALGKLAATVLNRKD